jgi:hypothetical protein
MASGNASALTAIADSPDFDFRFREQPSTAAMVVFYDAAGDAIAGGTFTITFTRKIVAFEGSSISGTPLVLPAASIPNGSKTLVPSQQIVAVSFAYPVDGMTVAITDIAEPVGGTHYRVIVDARPR